MRALSKLVLLLPVLALALVPATEALAKKRKGKAVKPAAAATAATPAVTAPSALKGSVPPEAAETAQSEPLNEDAKVWSEAEIGAAKAECEKLLVGLPIDFSYGQPIRQGRCGTPMPVEVRAIGAHPRIAFDPPATMNCRLLAKLVTWFASAVQPQARAVLKSPVVAVRNASSYTCRNRYGAKEGKLSEHATANALDLGGVTLEDGRTITIAAAWGPNLRTLLAEARAQAEAAAAAKALATAAAAQPADAVASSAPKPAAFTAPAGTDKAVKTSGELGASAAKRARLAEAKRLGIAVPKPKTPEAIFVHALHETACAVFGTVLGPEANAAHEDHLHVDLQPRRGGAFCE